MPYALQRNCLALIVLLFALKAGAGEVYVEVDTQAGTLTVLQSGAVLQEFEDIAIGRFGTTRDKRQGDNMTPLGTFHVSRITTDTRYHRFVGIDYPGLEDASRGLMNGVIDSTAWNRIRRSHRAGRVPPQDTRLGGHLGIHGIGEGDIEVHRSFNWTNGCIAMTNEQMDRLVEWVSIGTRVDIR